MDIESMTESIHELYPFVWKEMPEERFNAYTYKISPNNIIEAMQICSVWFGPDTNKMLGNICNLYIGENNNVFYMTLLCFQQLCMTTTLKYLEHKFLLYSI